MGGADGWTQYTCQGANSDDKTAEGHGKRHSCKSTTTIHLRTGGYHRFRLGKNQLIQTGRLGRSGNYPFQVARRRNQRRGLLVRVGFLRTRAGLETFATTTTTHGGFIPA